VDSWDQYYLDGEIRGVNHESRHYYMLVCYDRNFRQIDTWDVYVRGGTATTLAQDLVEGDEWAYLTDALNWYDDGTVNYSHAKTLALWHLTDDPEPYDVYKYSRRIRMVTEVDKLGNRVKLRYPYSGPTLVAGSPAQNHMSGGTYSYIGSGNALTSLTDWIFYRGVTSTTPSVSNIRYGTSYVKIGALFNRSATTGTPTTQFRNLRLYNVSQYQRPEHFKNKVFVDKAGHAVAEGFSEIGITDGLVAYYPLTKDAKDYSGNGYDGVVNGAVPVGGGFDGKGAYLFNGSGAFIDSEYPTADIANKSHTVLCWLYCDRDLTTSNFDRLTPFKDAASWAIGLWFNSSVLRVHTNGRYVDVPWTYTKGWHLLGQVYDAVTGELFAIIDGERLSGSITSYNASFTGNIRWGVNYLTGSNIHPMHLAGKKVLNRALSPEEIAVEYKRTGPAKMTQYAGRTYIQGEFKEVTA